MRNAILKAALIPILLAMAGIHTRRRRKNSDPLNSDGQTSSQNDTRNRAEEARVDPGAAEKKKRKRPPRKSVEDDPYQRYKLRKKDREKLFEQHKDEDGTVRDPESGEVIDENSSWVTGHKPGWEQRKHTEVAEQYGTDVYPRKGTAENPGFIEDSRNLDHYRPETKETSESHSHEEPDSVNYWNDLFLERYGTPEEAKARVEKD